MFDWQSVLNAIEGGVIVIDEHLNIASWNDWMARASGLSRIASELKTRWRISEQLCFAPGSGTWIQVPARPGIFCTAPMWLESLEKQPFAASF